MELGSTCSFGGRDAKNAKAVSADKVKLFTSYARFLARHDAALTDGFRIAPTEFTEEFH